MNALQSTLGAIALVLAVGCSEFTAAEPTTGAGGAGGKGAAGGGGTPPMMTCTWNTPAPTLLVSRAKDELSERIWMAHHSGEIAVVVEDSVNGAARHAAVYFVKNDDVTNIAAVSIGEVVAVTAAPDGPLFIATVGGKKLWIDEVDDKKLSGNPTAFATFDDLSQASPDLRAVLVHNDQVKVSSPPAHKPIAYYLSYNKSGTVGESVQAGDGLAPQALTDFPNMLSGNRPSGASVGPKMHVFVGEGDSGPVRHVSFDVLTGAAKVRQVAGMGVGEPFVIEHKGQLRVVAMESEPKLRLLFGDIAAADIGSFAFSDLTAGNTISSVAVIPADRGEFTWADDLLALVGRFLGKHDTLGYALWDIQGNDRGRSELPMRPELPIGETRTILTANIIADDNFFGDAGGSFNVAWLERRVMGVITTDQLYFDTLFCAPDSE
jgi:hypothetical protein